MVHSLQDLHNIGTFCSIIELQDLGDKLRMIVMAHRRIRITGQVVVDPKELQPEAIDVETQKDKKNRRRRRNNNNNKSKEEQEEASVAAEASENIKNAFEEEPAKVLGESEPAFEPVPVLVVETENIKPIKFAMTTEIKVEFGFG